MFFMKEGISSSELEVILTQHLKLGIKIDPDTMMGNTAEDHR